MDKPWKVIFAFVSVFIAGAVFGGFFTLRTAGGRKPGNFAVMDRPPMPGQGQMPGQGPGPGPGGQRPAQAGPGQPPLQAQVSIGPAMMRQFNQRLKLTEEQREKIRPLVGRAAEDLQRLSRENLQNTTRVVERLHLDIAAWLTPPQREALEDIKIQMRARVRKAADDMRGELPPRGDELPLRKKQGPLQPRSNQNQAAPSAAPNPPAGAQPPPNAAPANPPSP